MKLTRACGILIGFALSLNWLSFRYAFCYKIPFLAYGLSVACHE